MHCVRCHGLMGFHSINERRPAAWVGSPFAPDCLLCSEVFDAFLAGNGSRDPIRTRSTRCLVWACRIRHNKGEE